MHGMLRTACRDGDCAGGRVCVLAGEAGAECQESLKAGQMACSLAQKHDREGCCEREHAQSSSLDDPELHDCRPRGAWCSVCKLCLAYADIIANCVVVLWPMYGWHSYP